MMPRRLFVFDPPDRFVAGTVGQPGSRTFFLQARRAGQIVSVVLEKVQVAVLAERLGVLLDELESRGIEFQGDVIDSGVCFQTFFSDPDGTRLAIHHRYAPKDVGPGT